MSPPPLLENQFDGTHVHFLVTASTTFDSTHIEAPPNYVTEHSYANQPGTMLLIMLNRMDFKSSHISAWRAGEEYRSGSPLPRWDFIPAWISDETVHGNVPDAKYDNLDVWGSYGGSLAIKPLYIPPGYVAVVATGGPNSDVNALGFREHVDKSYQGHRHIPGRGPYPIQDRFFVRSFGVPGPVAPHLNGRPPSEGGIYMPRAPRVDPLPSGVGPLRVHRRPPNEARGYEGERIAR
jgi:hypothetical protein